MKIGAVTLAYNDEGIISGTIKCLKPFVDKHIVLISEKPYFGEASEPDRTEEICENLGTEVIKGNWALDHYQRTLGNKMCSDCDWVITFDSDEMMTKDELSDLIEFLKTTDSDVVCCKPNVYWKTVDYVLSPKPDYASVIATKPSVKFTYIRNVNKPFILYEGGMHHLSWCHPKDIYKKVINYAHATDFNGKEWYKEHYENWESTEEYAVLPTEKFKVVKQPLPGELRKWITD